LFNKYIYIDKITFCYLKLIKHAKQLNSERIAIAQTIAPTFRQSNPT